jgi:hypothetical protein
MADGVGVCLPHAVRRRDGNRDRGRRVPFLGGGVRVSSDWLFLDARLGQIRVSYPRARRAGSIPATQIEADLEQIPECSVPRSIAFAEISSHPINWSVSQRHAPRRRLSQIKHIADHFTGG